MSQNVNSIDLPSTALIKAQDKCCDREREQAQRTRIGKFFKGRVRYLRDREDPRIVPFFHHVGRSVICVGARGPVGGLGAVKLQPGDGDAGDHAVSLILKRHIGKAVIAQSR